ncbi:hypothetical protein CSUB01_00432 [Colletotrichum sublineola]|uniref:Uncharacterized protein n=1 Tax=Colletotrichum sublineola TaxID=1173701 RepID=A0A066XEM0_COLSU|nr:hypothetical protein CSUB01_00432 [Colletotrichum sublineola]
MAPRAWVIRYKVPTMVPVFQYDEIDPQPRRFSKKGGQKPNLIFLGEKKTERKANTNPAGHMPSQRFGRSSPLFLCRPTQRRAAGDGYDTIAELKTKGGAPSTPRLQERGGHISSSLSLESLGRNVVM